MAMLAKEEAMTKRLLRETVRELLSESKSIDKVIDVYYDLVHDEYHDGFVPVRKVEEDMDPKVEILDTRGKPKPVWKRRFDFVINSTTGDYDMTEKLTRRDRLKRFIRTFLRANPNFAEKKAGHADVRFGLSTGDDLTQEQIDTALENAGVTVSDVIMPGAPGSSSGKYATYVIIDDDDTTSFNVVFSTKIVHPPAFDSQGIPTYYGGAEAMQINAMNNALREVAGPNGVDIQLGSRILKNVGAIVPLGGNPKADAFFVPMKGGKVDIDSPMAYVSLKNAGSPPQMNQWSGISKFKEQPEVASFINGLRAYLASIGSAEVMPDGLSCRSEKSLSELKPGGLELATKACWGLSYPGKSGPESVDMIYICPAASVSLQKVKSTTGTYEFTGGISLYNGQLPSGEWAPYFYARRGDRNDGGIKKCRIFICPRDYRPSPEIIKNIENKSTVEVESLKLYIKDLIQEELATQNADHQMIENEIEDWLALNIFDSPRPTATITLVDRRANFRGTGGFRSQNILSKEIKIEHPSLDEGYIQFSLSEFQEVFGVPVHLRNYLQHSFY